MSVPEIKNSENGKCSPSKQEPTIKFPPFYKPHGLLRSWFTKDLKALQCARTEEVMSEKKQQIRDLAHDHGLYVASWLLDKKGQKIQGIILLKKRKKSTTKPPPPNDYRFDQDDPFLQRMIEKIEAGKKFINYIEDPSVSMLKKMLQRQNYQMFNKFENQLDELEEEVED